MSAWPGDGVCRVFGICQSDKGMAGLWPDVGDVSPRHQGMWLVHGVSLDGAGPPHRQGPGRTPAQ